MRHVITALGLCLAAAWAAAALEVTVGGQTVYVYGNALWKQSTTRATTQLVFLHSAAVDSATQQEVPFRADGYWEQIQDQARAGDLVLSVREVLTFEATTDTIADGDVVYLVEDRGPLVRARYHGLHLGGSHNKVLGDTIPQAQADALAPPGSSPDSLLTQAATLQRLRQAAVTFATWWAANPEPVPVRLTREQYEALIGGN